MEFSVAAQRVKMKLTDGSTLRGKINLQSDIDNMERLSDFFIKGKNPFIVLYEVSAQGEGNVVIVNKSQIVWITPDD